MIALNTHNPAVLSERIDLLRQAGVQKGIRMLKAGVWLYFLLLIFEGALRKWFLPALATPLLVVRDPIALWLLFLALRRGLIPLNFYMVAMVVSGVLAIACALLFGHGSLPVALYGARIHLIQFPMIFVIGSVFTRDDVIKMGKVVLIISIPMAVLIGLQFSSPQSAWVNRGVGGDVEGAGFSGALGYFRPPGTFSFTTGNAQFFGLVACFLLYFLLNAKAKMKLLLLGATAALLAAIPLSISRTLFFQVGISTFFLIIAVVHKPKYLGKLFIGIVLILVALVWLQNAPFFQAATEAFTSRFETASDHEGGLEGTLGDRFLGGMLSALKKSYSQPFFGYGIGMGTNVGSMLLVGGKTFLISEEEWGRVIGELGTLMGLFVIFVRIKFIVKLIWSGYRQLSAGEMLPWMLMSFGAMMVAQGQWAQPTALGFSVLIAGLTVAAFNHTEAVGDAGV